jgi:cation diffusion facilitator CzcD-associated flavoprotein CzcO
VVNAVDVAIIGAGPYGLSIASHLGQANVNYRIFGSTMGAWKHRMPPGMLLKSHAWSSSLYDPGGELTLENFCARRGLPYHDSDIPVPLETYVAYGEAFQRQFVPDVENRELIKLDWTGSAFHAVFHDGESLYAKRVIIAVGIHHFSYIPPQLSDLPAELVTHSGTYGPIDKLAGKQVIIVGAGASASGLAALVSEIGAEVLLVARDSELPFPKLPRKSRSLLRRLARPLSGLIYPKSGIGGTWLLKICADTPQIIHALPAPLRLHIAREALGPSGHSNLRDRVIGKVPVLLGHSVHTATASGRRIRLALATKDGTKESFEADHVIAATGFRPNINRLAFLRPLLAGIDTEEGTPRLNSRYESSVPGLYFVGPITANSYGPVARFAFGAIHPARTITAHLSETRATRRIAAPLTTHIEPTKN